MKKIAGNLFLTFFFDNFLQDIFLGIFFWTFLNEILKKSSSPFTFLIQKFFNSLTLSQRHTIYTPSSWISIQFPASLLPMEASRKHPCPSHLPEGNTFHVHILDWKVLIGWYSAPFNNLKSIENDLADALLLQSSTLVEDGIWVHTII